MLKAHKKEKMDKYPKSCHALQKDFTPMVYTVDGIAGIEAKSTEKHFATAFAEKWNKPYNEMVI